MVRLLQKTTAQNKKLIPVPHWAIKQTRNNKVIRKFQKPIIGLHLVRKADWIKITPSSIALTVLEIGSPLISGMKIGQTKFVFSGFRLHKALVL